ncbi:hypothetical protein DM02DRAFT_416948 [Periconia macrospinosa]|uniref:Rhodopsin domain-containing protein n=1 Tax=Periconia macrospinosa TaxID=97972 RepID=A0A2V1DNV7_9PLEO|nr:hypothetical protein DM02DRAFT_416948 [Periconia macrospinosa]
MSFPPSGAGPPDLSHFPPEYLAADNSAPLFHTCIAFLVIDTIFMILLYAARIIDKKTNMSMLILMTSAYFVCLGKISVGILAVYFGGAGRHTATLTRTEFITSLKLGTILQIICPLTTSLSKLGILILLDAILGTASRTYKLLVKATFTFVLVTAVIQVVVPFSNCKPFAYNWDKAIPGSCAIDALKLWKYMSIPNVCSTVVMVCMPVPAMWRLRVSPATKLGLCVVFGVCIGGVVAAVGRFVAFAGVGSFVDFTWEEVAPLGWTVAESGVYLVAGVSLTLRPLVRRVCGDGGGGAGVVGRFLSRTSGGSGSWGRLEVKEIASDGSSKGTVEVGDEESGLVDTKGSLAGK